jgi:hypothetical protein
MLIALHGQAGAGKSTFARELCDNHGFTLLSFAAPVYATARALLAGAYPDKHFEKADHVPLINMTFGALLQKVGTEFGRHVLGEDVWVDHMGARIGDAAGPVVIDDLRFPNEAEFIRARGGLVVEIVRQGHKLEDGRDHTHASALRLPADLMDYSVQNNADMDKLLYAAIDIKQNYSKYLTRVRGV